MTVGRLSRGIVSTCREAIIVDDDCRLRLACPDGTLLKP